MKKKLTRTGPLRVHHGRRGKLHVVADVTPSRFKGWFRVRLAARLAFVGEGTVNNLTPTIGGATLDANPPGVDLSAGPNSALRSWVCLRVSVDLQKGALDEKTPDAQTIVHVNDLMPYVKNGLALDDGHGRALWPLAMIVWQDARTPKRVVRNVYFNQSHTFMAAKAPAKAWHIFSPLA